MSDFCKCGEPLYASYDDLCLVCDAERMTSPNRIPSNEDLDYWERKRKLEAMRRLRTIRDTNHIRR